MLSNPQGSQSESIHWIGSAPDAIAELLDEVRTLIAESRDRGVEPRVLAVSPSTYQVLAQAKGREVQRGHELYLIGLKVKVQQE